MDYLPQLSKSLHVKKASSDLYDFGDDKDYLASEHDLAMAYDSDDSDIEKFSKKKRKTTALRYHSYSICPMHHVIVCK